MKRTLVMMLVFGLIFVGGCSLLSKNPGAESPDGNEAESFRAASDMTVC